MLSLLVTLIVSVLVVLYFNLGLILNVDRLKAALNKYQIFKSYSWESGEINWINEGLVGKTLQIHFKNLCFEYEKPDLKAKGCFNKISFETELLLFPPFVKYHTPLIVESGLLSVHKKESKEEESSEDVQIDIRKYYSYLWNRYVPDLSINLKKIDLYLPEKHLDFPLSLIKSKDHLSITSRPINVVARKKNIEVFLDENIKVPIEDYHFELKKALLKLNLAENIGIEFTSLFEFIDLSFSSLIPSVIHTSRIQDVVARFLTDFKLSLRAPRVQHHLQTLLRPPYNTLPAPLNEMDGDVSFEMGFENISNEDFLGKGELKLDFKSSHQTLKLSLLPQFILSAKDYSYKDIMINLDFHDVLLELPRFSKRSLPPQMVPDARFKTAKVEPKKTQAPVLLDLNIKGEEETSLHLKTDLIEEIIRLNFHFDIKNNELVDGYVRLLPLKLKILKRPIAIDRLWVRFSKVSAPTLNSIIWFNLPEYKIKLVLEGPVNSPRYVFTSEPPLPQSDIYSVLLFGRPLQDMGGDNTAVAQQTSQLISQGLLSLSVLYVLSGTPIEYIGYDPKSKEATAQVGLGDKNSLRFTSGEEGRTTGVRRSLGKGWYLDTSVQTPSGASNQKSQDYGLFLERIISY